MSTNQQSGNDGASDERPKGATAGQPGDDAGDSIISDAELSTVAGGVIGKYGETNVVLRSAPSPTSYTIKP